MRIFAFFLIISFLGLPAFSQEVVFPEKEDTLTDHTREIDPQTRAKIMDLANDLREATSINLKVVVVRTTKPLDAESYGRQLYDKWDVGQRERGLDHGVLLLVSILDRQVKIVAGRGVDYILTPKIREDIEWGLFPFLGEGKVAEGVHVGAAAISQFIQAEWPTYRRPDEKIDIRTFSIVLFSLTVAAILLSLVFGGDFYTAFGTIVGGLFGFFLLRYLGLVLGAGIGFALNIGTPVKEAVKEEKAREKLYKEWIEKKRRARQEKGGRR